MRKTSLLVVFCALALSFAGLMNTVVSAQAGATILADADLKHVTPTSFYFEGQSAPTQMRNAAAVKFAANRFVVVGLVDTSGYSTEIQGKYEGFFITDSPITVGGQSLAPGAYGFGFAAAAGKFNLFDVGGKQFMSVDAHQDKELKRPRPLQILKQGDELRLYNERTYVVFAAA